MRVILAGAVLALDLWALLSIFGSTARFPRKLLWTGIVVVVPVAGALGWMRRRENG